MDGYDIIHIIIDVTIRVTHVLSISEKFETVDSMLSSFNDPEMILK